MEASAWPYNQPQQFEKDSYGQQVQDGCNDGTTLNDDESDVSMKLVQGIINRNLTQDLLDKNQSLTTASPMLDASQSYFDQASKQNVMLPPQMMQTSTTFMS